MVVSSVQIFFLAAILLKKWYCSKWNEASKGGMFLLTTTNAAFGDFQSSHHNLDGTFRQPIRGQMVVSWCYVLILLHTDFGFSTDETGTVIIVSVISNCAKSIFCSCIIAPEVGSTGSTDSLYPFRMTVNRDENHLTLHVHWAAYSQDANEP